MQYQHLLEHIEVKHRAATVPVEDTNEDLWKCKDCMNKFPRYVSMMKHRKQNHPKNCRDFPKGTCSRGESCWWVHPETPETAESVGTQNTGQTEAPFKCHTCNEPFASKNAMMKHKKAKHTNNIPCREFPNCCRSAEQCWYKHDAGEQPRPSAPPPSASAQQGFQQIPSPQQPPDQMTLMMEMLRDLQSQMNTISQDVQILKQ